MDKIIQIDKLDSQQKETSVEEKEIVDIKNKIIHDIIDARNKMIEDDQTPSQIGIAKILKKKNTTLRSQVIEKFKIDYRYLVQKGKVRSIMD